MIRYLLVTWKSLIVEHLVAEVVRLDSEVVSSHLSLVLENDKAHNSHHKAKHGNSNKDDVANSHPRLLLCV